MDPAHRRYFERNRGDWDWTITLQLSSWGDLLSADVSLATRWRLAMTFAMQAVFGRLRLWTRVTLEDESDEVVHLTEVRKLGITWFRSRETMRLLEDGSSMRIEGQQYIWPAMRRALPFGPFSGEVLPSSTEAVYRMETLGVPCEFRSTLDGEQGIMRFQGEWLSGAFELSQECRLRLLERRELEINT